jgi:hypothetical protein
MTATTTLRHPWHGDAPTPAAVTVRPGTRYYVDGEGRVDVPTEDVPALVASWAERYGLNGCPAVTTDGDTCGRERPCQYHPTGGDGE